MNTVEEVDAVVEILPEIVGRLREEFAVAD
jgi:hypothetical protein